MIEPRTETKYKYDGDGKRVSKSNGVGYLYDLDGNIIGDASYAYYYMNGMRLARHNAQNEVDFFLTDHLGSTRYIFSLDSTHSNAVPSESDFYPFGGERVITTGANPTPYKFTGKERDTESGDDNFLARFYTSNLGRFTSPDPDGVGVIENDPQTWNAFSYVRNNPLRYIDPNGMAFCRPGNDIEKSQGVPVVCISDSEYINGGDKYRGLGFEHFYCSCDSDADRAAYKRYISGATSEDDILAPIIAGGLYGGLRAGIRGGIRGLVGAGTKTATEQGARAAAEQVVANGTKAAVQDAVESSGLPDAVKATVKRAISRGAAGNKYTVEKLSDGTIKVVTEVAGRAGGRAEYVKIIDGTTGITKSVTQNAYDAVGNLVHNDPKL